MATSGRTAKKKSSSASKKKAAPAPKAPAAPSRFWKTRGGRLILALMGTFLSMAILFSAGSVGIYGREISSLVLGGSFYFVYPILCVYAFFRVFFPRKALRPVRLGWGLGLLAFGWMLACALFVAGNDSRMEAVHQLAQSLSLFFQGGFYSRYGLIGAYSAAGLISLFSSAGAWFIAVLTLGGGLVILFWNWVKVLYIHFSSLFAEHRRSRQERKEQEEWEQDSQEEEDEASDRPEKASRWKQKLAALIGRDEEEPEEQPVLVSDFGEEDISDIQPVKETGKSKSRRKRKDNASSQNAWKEADIASDDAVYATIDPSALPEPYSGIDIPLDEDFAPAKPKDSSRVSKARNQSRPKLDKKPIEGVQQSLFDDIHENKPVADALLANYRLPPLALLADPVKNKNAGVNAKTARQAGETLVDTLAQFNVEAVVTDIHIGPSVTKFEVVPEKGTRVNVFNNLQGNIMMALEATDLRLEIPIPGKNAVGIEIPNVVKTTVTMKELMNGVPAQMADFPLTFGLGKDLMGKNVYGRLDTMPHLLIAGATGSGKSVCVNSIICSLLMRTRPDEVKMVLVDPKKVEFMPYNDVPHLMSPVITDQELAGKALDTVAEIMEARYDLFAESGARNIAAYNKWVQDHPQVGRSPMPRIVVVIDELADLMVKGSSKLIEQAIQRITQKARAAGIHMIVATQRPSVNVITGVIKANIPSRIAFAVSSSADSRVILDSVGAEKLLGQGDMLFMNNGDTNMQRVQGAFIQDAEVKVITDFVKDQASPQYDEAFLRLSEAEENEQMEGSEVLDPLYNDVKEFVISTRKASTSLIQRRFAIGYSRAAKIMDQLERNRIIGPLRGSKPREVLAGASREDYEEEEFEEAMN